MLFIILTLLLAAMILTLIIVAFSKRNVNKFEYDKEIFKFYQIMFIGKYVYEFIYEKRYNIKDNKRYQKLLDYYTQLRGKRLAEQYTKQHLYYGMSLALGVFMLTMLISASLYYTQVYTRLGLDNEISQINRPEYGESEEPVQYEVVINKDGVITRQNVELVVRKEKPNAEDFIRGGDEIELYLDTMFDELLIDGALVTNVELPSYSQRYEIGIEWFSSDPSIMLKNGRINSLNVPEEGATIELSARFYAKGYEGNYSRELLIRPDEFSNFDVYGYVIEEVNNELDNRDKASVQLPKKVGDESNNVEVVWKTINENSKASNKYLIVFALGIALSYFVRIMRDSNIKENILQKQQSIQMDFPVFADKFILYIYCGMAPERALVKYLSQEQKDTELNKELKQTLREIEYYGIDQKEAFLNFGRRVRVPEILKFSTLVAQMVLKGDSEIQASLYALVRDAWEEKRQLALELGNRASTKLLLPMMLLLMVVIVIVIAPAFLTMGSI